MPTRGAILERARSSAKPRELMSREARRALDIQERARASVLELSRHLKTDAGIPRGDCLVLGALIRAWREGGAWVSALELQGACGWFKMRPEDVGRELAGVMLRLRRFLGETKFGAAGGDAGAWIEVGPPGYRLRTGKRAIAVRNEGYGVGEGEE